MTSGEYFNQDISRDRGAQFVSRAVHSEPTTVSLHRGMGMDVADIERLKPGESLSLPLSSFSVDPDKAGEFLGSHRIKDGEMRVKMELLPGAKVADVPSFIHEGERVGFGQFEVVSNKVTYSRTGVPTARMQIRQTSMREDVVVNPKPGTAALKERIPEYTVVGKPGEPPAGMDREKWITTVQPGPIPDYDNSHAVSAQLQHRHPDRKIDLGSMIDPSLARSTAQELDDLMTKYPEAQLRSAIARGPYNFQNSSRYAQTDVYNDVYGAGRKVLSGTEVQFNQDFYTKRATLEKSYAQTTDLASRHVLPGTHPIYGYHPPLADGVDAAKAIAAHEFGHTMDASGSYRASAAVKDTLRREFLRLNPYTPEQRAIDQKLVANAAKRGIKLRAPIETRYEAWLQDSLSGYSFTKGGQLNPTEALAEAFGHGEYDPKHITDAERVLHKLAVDMHTMPYRRDMKVPEWQMATDAKKVAMSKESKRLLKAYQKQVDEAVKVAHKADVAAAKTAKKVKPPRVGAGGKFTAPHDLGKNMPTGRGAGTAFLDHDKMVANILARYQDCLKPENAWIIDAGKTWYPKAGEWLDWLIKDSGFTGTRERAAALAAAFSENTGWSQNMLKAENFFRGFKITEGSPGLNTARRVAAATGDPIEALHTNDIHWKTINFAKAILGDPNAVAIDRWAARIAMGTEDSQAAKLITSRRGAYDKFAEAYRDAAKQLGLKPSELQAITWVHAVPPDATVRYFKSHTGWGWAK